MKIIDDQGSLDKKLGDTPNPRERSYVTFHSDHECPPGMSNLRGFLDVRDYICNVCATSMEMSSRPTRTRCVEPIGPFNQRCSDDLDHVILSFLSLPERGRVRCTEHYANPKAKQNEQNFLHQLRLKEDQEIHCLKSRPRLEAMLYCLRHKQFALYEYFIHAVRDPQLPFRDPMPELSHIQVIRALLSKKEHKLLAECIQKIPSWSRIKWLQLDNNVLDAQKTPLSPSLTKLVGLTDLRLENINLNVLSPWFGKFKGLTELHLSHNFLESLPDEFGNLTRLTRLFLDDNQLTDLPPTFGKLTKLTWLRLGSNRLTLLPTSFCNLTGLEKLWLNHNQIASLPDEFGNLIHLNFLHLGNNNLTSLPSSMIKLEFLKRLNLDENEFNDSSNPPVSVTSQNDIVPIIKWSRSQVYRV